MKIGESVKFDVSTWDFDEAIKGPDPCGVDSCLVATALKRHGYPGMRVGYWTVAQGNQVFCIGEEASRLIRKFCDERTRTKVRAMLPKTLTLTRTI